MTFLTCNKELGNRLKIYNLEKEQKCKNLGRNLQYFQKVKNKIKNFAKLHFLNVQIEKIVLMHKKK